MVWHMEVPSLDSYMKKPYRDKYGRFAKRPKPKKRKIAHPKPKPKPKPKKKVKKEKWEDLNDILDSYIENMDLEEDDIGGSP